MKKYLYSSLAFVLFGAGFALGRGEFLPELGQVSAQDSGDVASAGSAGAVFTWEQIDNVLDIKVLGTDEEFLGAAILNDPDAWPELGSGESQVLSGGSSFSLDLTDVDQLTFYSIEAIGSLDGGVFRPCDELPAGCFAPRPPTPPPWPDLHHVYASGH